MEEHLAAFLEALRNRAVSEHTLSSYESDLRDFEQFLRSRQATIDSIAARLQGSRSDDAQSLTDAADRLREPVARLVYALIRFGIDDEGGAR